MQDVDAIDLLADDSAAEETGCVFDFGEFGHETGRRRNQRARKPNGEEPNSEETGRRRNQTARKPNSEETKQRGAGFPEVQESRKLDAMSGSADWSAVRRAPSRTR